MKYSCFGIVWFSLLLWIIDAKNITSLPKTKRNLSRDIQSYGESSLVIPYASSPKVYYEPKPTYYQARPLALVDLTQPVKVIEPKVAAEQVLYEFQQTPTDSISNVHVKQLFQPDLKPPPQQVNNSPSSPSLGVMTSETIVAPVQQPHFIQNQVQPYNIKQHPLYSVQPTFFEPKKYVYGKIIVDSALPPQPQIHHFSQNPTAFHSNQQFGPQAAPFTHSKPVINHVNHFPRNNVVYNTEQLPPITKNNKFRPPPRSQHQPIDTPVHIEKPNRPKSNPVDKPVVDNEDVEDEEENSEYEEEDHEEYEPSEKYEKYVDDDDHHKEYEHFEEDDDEFEEDKRPSKHVYKSEHSPKKYRKPKKSKYNSRYGYPDEKFFKSDKYKYKYKHAKKTKYPKSELEGRFSEPIPVTHKKKILKEQWYLSKSLADRYDKD